MSKKEVKLKASILDLVGPLLKQLKNVVENDDAGEKKIILTKMIKDIEELKKRLGVRDEWETKLIGCIGQIERQIDKRTSESNENKRRERESNEKVIELNELRNELHELVQKAYDVLSKDDEANRRKVNVEDEVKVGASPNVGESEEVKELIECMKELNPQLRDCLYSLGIFPVNEKLKKRLLIYWWIGMGFVPLQGNKYRTAEQYAEILFEDLMDQGILIPDGTNKLLYNQAVKWCTIQPTIHEQLIYACRRKGVINEERNKEKVWFYGDGQANNNESDGQASNNNSNAKVNNTAVLNCKQKYLNSDVMKKVLAENRALQVLQFGWWRYPSEVLQHGPDDEKASTQKTKSKEHIEVDGIDFLKQASANVTYLSLRGISGVEELPQDIGKQQNLMILDLRACHNLEKLPEKPRSTLREFLKPILPKVLRSKLRDAMWLKNLNHLDMSECYLLDHMPKWICELSNLEVLKGFVAADATSSKDQFCQIGDLSKLKKLRKLSIKVAKLSEEVKNPLT